MSNRYLILSIVLLGFLALSCEKNTQDQVPSYIHIDKIGLSTDYVNEGTNRADIYDAWVYVDNQLIGAFELPATFPVLYTGKHHVEIRGGIIVNDNVLNRTHYEFFNSYEIPSAQLDAGKVYRVSPNPILKYDPRSIFSWKEDFETGISLDTTSQSLVQPQFVTDSANVYEGSRSAMVTLDATKNFFELQSHDKFVIPSSSTVYLEMNYKSDMDFTTGIFAEYQNNVRTQAAVKTLTSSEGYWKKVYIQLTTSIGSRPQAVDFRIFFGGPMPAGQNTGHIYFDNIKLLHN